jgi:hypothetical protein
MDICGMCQEQTKKSLRGNPHEYLAKIDSPRIFKGVSSRGYEEQDYQCQVCKSKFTRSTNRNDLMWTLWQG